MLNQRAVILLLLCGAGLCGCASGSGKQFQPITRQSPSKTDVARRLTVQGANLIDKGKWKLAQDVLEEAVEADVAYGAAHNDLGTVYLNDNNLYQAAWEFQYAARLLPDQAEPKNNLGLVFEAGGKLDEAVDAYDQALKREPDNPQYLGNEARAKIRRGDRDARVRELLTKLVSLDTRPEWLDWAREKLVLMGSPTSTQPTNVP